MRISDWSSDVCSSDLRGAGGRDRAVARRPGARLGHGPRRPLLAAVERDVRCDGHALPGRVRGQAGMKILALTNLFPSAWDPLRASFRSEEHTYELQSIMRNSYAVFCLKKKKHKTNKYQ